MEYELYQIFEREESAIHYAKTFQDFAIRDMITRTIDMNLGAQEIIKINYKMIDVIVDNYPGKMDLNLIIAHRLEEEN